MNTYARIKAWTREVLDNLGYDDVMIYPGPELPDIPNRYVVWSRYGGPGMELDGAMDAKSWQMRVVGKQDDYESAEEVADAIDIAMLSHVSSHVGGVWVSNVQRAGGAPAVQLVDDSDRTHFVCSYIVSVELALSNG